LHTIFKCCILKPPCTCQQENTNENLTNLIIVT